MARVALFLSIIFITSVAKAQQERSPVPVISSEALATPIPINLEELTVMNFTFRDSSRHWAAEDSQATHIGQSFVLWLQCFQNPEGENCNNCSDHDDPNVREITLIAENQCLPARGDVPIAYSPLLTQEQKVLRDDAICSCYRERNSGALNDIQFQLGFDTEDKAGREALREERREFREREQRLLQTNLQQQAANRLITQRFQMGLSAGSYDSDASRGLVLGGLYTASQNRGRQQSQAGLTGTAIEAIYERADRRRLNLQDFTGENIMAEGGVCIPYPSFLASKQFPDDEDFYRYLDQENTFDWEEWSYPLIMNRLRKEIGRTPLQEALRTKPDVRRLYSRVKFLYDNPVLKSIFSAPKENKETKEALFTILKTIPRPTCNRGRCEKDTRWANGVERYRNQMAEFLRGLPARQAAQAGSSDGQNLSLQVAVASTRSARPTSDVLLADEDSSTPRNWRLFCDNRQLQDSSNQSPEITFIKNIEESLGLRDFENPRNDAEFMRANGQICQGGRRAAQGTGVMDFSAYLQSRCRSSTEGDCSLANRGRIVGDFLRAYPTSTREDDSKTVQSLLPFLGGIASQSGSVTAQGIANFNAVASTPGLANASYAEVSGHLGIPSAAEVSSPRSLTSASIDRPAGPTAIQQPALVRDPNLPLNPQLSGPLFVPSEQASATAAVSETQDRSRATPERQGGNRAIMDELSALRSTLGQEREKGTGEESPQVTDLNRRIADLEERLRRSQLRGPASEIPEPQTVNPRPEVAREVPSDEPVRRSVRPQAAETAVTAGSFSSAGAQSSAGFGGGGNAGGVSNGSTTGVAGRSAPVLSTNFLSKYQGVRVEESGAITVVSGDENYRQLEADAGSNEIAIPTSFAEFQSLPETERQQYLERARGLSGNVIRLTFSDGEAFVVKDGNEIAVVTTSPSALAGQAGVALQPERVNTLQGLRTYFLAQ